MDRCDQKVKGSEKKEAGIIGPKELRAERPMVLKKKRQVEELCNNLKGAKLLALIRLRNLPDRLFQKTRKLLRGDVKIFVNKKTVVKRAFERLGYNDPKLTMYLNEPVAVLISSTMSPYKLYWFLKRNTFKRAAKSGEIAPFDIIVPEGETEFPPGPVLSELKAAKIQARVQGGKIVVAKDSLVAKEGEVITESIAKALQKLGIFPFDVNVEMLIAKYDGTIFTPELLNLSQEQLTQELRASFIDGYALSVNSNIPTKDNIGFLIRKAYMQGYSFGVNQSIYSAEVIKALIQRTLVQSRGLMSFTGSN